MPRRGENIYKRKDGRWEGRIQKPNGKYQYIYAQTYKEAKEKKLHSQACVKPSEERRPRAGQSASELFELWLKNGVADGVKPATYENYYRCIQKYVVPFFKNQDDCITELCVGQFVKSIYDNPTLSEPYKRKIISIFKTALKGITKNADDRASIVQQIRLPRAENPIVPVFSVGEQRLIENAALNADDKRALGILLCFYTGLRLGELCALRWGDIDLETGTMSVLRTVSRVRDFRRPQDQSALLVGTPKSKKSIRMIPLPAFLQNVFREWKMGAENDNCYVLSGKNIPVEPRTYQKLYKRILTGAGVKHRKFHAIRHTFATRALELGVDIKTLSDILGHSSVSITLNIYAHSLMEQKKIAISKFNEMHFTQMGTTPFAVTGTVITA